MKKVKIVGDQPRTAAEILESMGGKILVTLAQKTGIVILNERPVNMPIEVYKAHLRKQRKQLKNVLR
jgi:hypothetical protein